MGYYLNPSNDGFIKSIRSKIYVDKSSIISYTNGVLNTKQEYICFSRPRRFGKTMTAEMLAAYYNREDDAAELFNNLKISKDPSFIEHLNKYNVIFLNIQEFLSRTKKIIGLIKKVKNSVINEIKDAYPDFKYASAGDLVYVLKNLYQKTGIPVVFIIDEWDCIFREYITDKNAQNKYLDFLRDLFKDREYVALAYMTGILPIKKYGSHSALNMFDEFSMTNPAPLTEFVGFTREEVEGLCNIYNVDYEDMAQWYDGYHFHSVKSVFNPKSVVTSLLRQCFDNYWSQTETYEALSVYMQTNFGGLKDAVIRLLAGERMRIDIRSFTNDMVTFTSYNDVLTLLIHLGYLGYDFNNQEVYIPNKEIADEFVSAVRVVGWNDIWYELKASDDLLTSTWKEDAQAVARALEKAHNEMSIIKYNDENSLSCVISLAYYSARQYYNIVREMPAGKGFADLVFIPRKNHMEKPAMIMELKWNKSTGAAFQQINDKQYAEILKDYMNNALLIAINYDKESKKHDCVIKKYCPL